MKAKEIEAIESYIKTENEYWNDFSFTMLLKAMEAGHFDNLATPLRILDNAVDLITEHHASPVKAADLFLTSIEKEILSPVQKHFVFDYVCRYLNESDFSADVDVMPVLHLLEIETDKLKAELSPAKPLTKNIRETLKEVMQQEIEKLPETLKALEPAERLNVLCKLMPFIVPKVDSVHPTFNEPKENSLNW